jgi:leader peptidase (prepilin peptidase)/N-methyltransferase
VLSVVTVVAAGVAGAVAGRGLRALLARVRRGAVVPPGWLELGGGVLTAAGVLVAGGSARLASVVLAGLLLLALGAVDLLHHRLPDALTGPAVLVVAIVLLGTELAAPGSGALLTAVVCAVVVAAAGLGLARMAPGAFGLGDVKLLPSLVLLTGYWSAAAAVVGILLGFLLGAVAAVVGVALGRWRMDTAIAFGPYLLGGTWLVLAFPGLAAVAAG